MRWRISTPQRLLRQAGKLLCPALSGWRQLHLDDGRLHHRARVLAQKRGIKTKQKRAGWSREYLTQVLIEQAKCVYPEMTVSQSCAGKRLHTIRGMGCGFHFCQMIRTSRLDRRLLPLPFVAERYSSSTRSTSTWARRRGARRCVVRHLFAP